MACILCAINCMHNNGCVFPQSRTVVARRKTYACSKNPNDFLGSEKYVKLSCLIGTVLSLSHFTFSDPQVFSNTEK